MAVRLPALLAPPASTVHEHAEEVATPAPAVVAGPQPSPLVEVPVAHA
jgi:hypothetical protein